MNTVTLNLAAIAKIADDQFYDLCLANPAVKFERNSRGEAIILAPTDGETGIYNAGLIAQFWIWNNRFKLGKVFDSSTCFKLPNNANRSPDVSWISLERWNALTVSQKDKRQFKDEMQRVLMKQRILRKGCDSQEIFSVYDL
jgi:Uma2 family endonuclease